MVGSFQEYFVAFLPQFLIVKIDHELKIAAWLIVYIRHSRPPSYQSLFSFNVDNIFTFEKKAKDSNEIWPEDVLLSRS